MQKQAIYTLFTILAFVFILLPACAQQTGIKQDTFFLAKKKGLIGRFGKSISINVSPEEPPQKIINPLLKYKGKIIRSVIISQLDFGCNVYDTCEVSSTFGTRIANRLHRKSSDNLIKKNLFFKEGDKLYPNLIADNERYLRDLVYIQDARILVEYAEKSTDSVDVVVLTKDIFPVGGKIVIDTRTKGRAELKNENIGGSGNRVMVSGFYEESRNPHNGVGAEMVLRNIKGTFVDWTSGFHNYNSAFSSGYNEETAIYTKFEKPLVTPYKPSTGAMEFGYYKTRNAYSSDSVYNRYYKYEYYNADGWVGYSLDSKKSLYASKEINVHRFIALRGFHQRFLTVPDKVKDTFDYRFTDFTGALASINIFKQVFYKTSFIYGFGRSEDIPQGYSMAFTAGYINKQNFKRPYAGIDVGLANIKNKGAYYNYTIRLGGYYYQKRFEDIDMLFNIEHFTRLRKLKEHWFQRFYINSGITAQPNPKLNTPLFLNSDYGLPYFNNENIAADLRATLKAETVFYNTRKVLGFKFAPFVFADLSLLKPSKMGLQKSDLYSAYGGGIRTRNENLVFGTIELRGYYFPRINGDMNSWKVELNSNIRFKYNSSFIHRPDFIIAN
jgi:hypothetical protein